MEKGRGHEVVGALGNVFTVLYTVHIFSFIDLLASSRLSHTK